MFKIKFELIPEFRSTRRYCVLLMRTKYMHTFTSHYCQEGEQREILLAVFACFCKFSKGLSTENLLFRQEGMAD